MSKKTNDVAQRLELKALSLLESILDSCDSTLQAKNLSTDKYEFKESSQLATEKTSDGEENFDGFLPITVNQQYFYQFSIWQLKQIRDSCRIGVITTEIGQNIQRHFVNNIIGDGLIYTIEKTELLQDPVKLSKAMQAKPDLNVRKLTENWETFRRVNKFELRLPNIIERSMRDGECPLRLFNAKVGGECPTVRFVDPQLIIGIPDFQWGVIHNPIDIEEVTGYNYNSQGITYEMHAAPSAASSRDVTIPADQMVFIKRNTDFEAPRGLPDYWPVLSTMRRVEKTLTNTSVMVQIQSAIAMVREFTTSSQTQVDALINSDSDSNGKVRTNAMTQKNVRAKGFSAGTIFNGGKDVKYVFPAAGADPSKYTAVADRDLAQIASRFLLPVSWLLSSEPQPLDPGSPTARNFVTEQSFYYCHIVELFWKVQAMMGFDMSKRGIYSVLVEGPRLAFGNTLDEVRADQLLVNTGAVSPQSISSKHNYNFNRERALTIAYHNTLQPGEVMPGTLGNTTGQTNDGVSTKKNGQEGTKVADGSGSAANKGGSSGG